VVFVREMQRRRRTIIIVIIGIEMKMRTSGIGVRW
jgi:hypothetical protein